MLSLPKLTPRKILITSLLIVSLAALVYYLLAPYEVVTSHNPLKMCKVTCEEIQRAVKEREDPLLFLNLYCRQYLLPGNYSLIVDARTDSINPYGLKVSCNRVHGCFNLLNQSCTFNGRIIGPKMCRDTLCSFYKWENLSLTEAEQRIKVIMTPSGCNMTRAAHPELKEETWWEMYFENPNCSAVYQNAS